MLGLSAGGQGAHAAEAARDRAGDPVPLQTGITVPKRILCILLPEIAVGALGGAGCPEGPGRAHLAAVWGQPVLRGAQGPEPPPGPLCRSGVSIAAFPKPPRSLGPGETPGDQAQQQQPGRRVDVLGCAKVHRCQRETGHSFSCNLAAEGDRGRKISRRKKRVPWRPWRGSRLCWRFPG